MCSGERSEGGRTLGIELQDVDVAVCVRDSYVELSVRREEGGGYHFDGMGRFAEEAELVRFLLCAWSVPLLLCVLTSRRS